MHFMSTGLRNAPVDVKQQRQYLTYIPAISSFGVSSHETGFVSRHRATSPRAPAAVTNVRTNADPSRNRISARHTCTLRFAQGASAVKTRPAALVDDRQVDRDGDGRGRNQ